MAAFAILTGKSLAKAIAGFGKVSATYAEKTHQLAYSALNHVELHNDACHLNGMYAVTPVNYRAALVKWAVAFGKVEFDAIALTFSYKKGKASDMPAALEISPADYVKASSTKTEPTFDEVEQLEKVIKRFADKGASKRMVAALKGVLRVMKGEAEPAAANVVPAATVIKARKAKATKPAKEAKPAAA